MHPTPTRTHTMRNDAHTRAVADDRQSSETQRGERITTPRPPSSRTGTAIWKRIRKQAIQRALANNVHNCEHCGVGLDYEYSQRPNSAEVDHILPHSRGGTDTLDNVTVICRWCNQRKGNGTRGLKRPKPVAVEPVTRVAW